MPSDEICEQLKVWLEQEHLCRPKELILVYVSLFALLLQAVPTIDVFCVRVKLRSLFDKLTYAVAVYQHRNNFIGVEHIGSEVFSVEERTNKVFFCFYNMLV